MIFIAWSTAALLTGFLLDALFGDPSGFPHITRWIGWLIAASEKLLRRALPETERAESVGGLILVLSTTLICMAAALGLLWWSYGFSPVWGYGVESFLCYQLLAVKSLKVESMKVYHSLRYEGTECARRDVSMIVGRDTSVLDRDGITRAAVETVAENASDGVAAPLLYMMLGGAVFGCLYKAVNTMDSMVGYKNDKYIHFGRFAAKTDDVLNYIPSRICALLMVASAYLFGFDGKNAFRVWRRDRRKHASPNAAQTEAVCAGALGIRLAGPAVYHGTLYNKPYIGDDTRPIRDKDIISANKLMYGASVLTLLLAVLFRIICLGVVCFGSH